MAGEAEVLRVLRAARAGERVRVRQLRVRRPDKQEEQQGRGKEDRRRTSRLEEVMPPEARVRPGPVGMVRARRWS